MTKEKQFSFLSKDGKTKIHAVKWMPESGEYRAVLQITHGMVEYIERYKPFAEFLNDQGVLVVGHDHLGHGASVASEEELGYFAEPDPSDTLVEDMHTLRTTIQTENPGVPYFMMGHSMGSFITRDFIAKYGDELAGATICGTTGIFRGAEETGKKLKEAIDAGHGEESDPSYTGELMGWMCERCGEVSIGNEWICADPYVQRDHADDPFDAFTRPTSNRSVYDFIQMMLQIEGTKWAEKVPTDMPIYNIAGDQDPVGEYGVGVYQVSNWLVQTGHNVTTKLYSGYRHEIHNYAEIKNEVEAGIIAFMDKAL